MKRFSKIDFRIFLPAMLLAIIFFGSTVFQDLVAFTDFFSEKVFAEPVVKKKTPSGQRAIELMVRAKKLHESGNQAEAIRVFFQARKLDAKISLPDWMREKYEARLNVSNNSFSSDPPAVSSNGEVSKNDSKSSNSMSVESWNFWKTMLLLVALASICAIMWQIYRICRILI